MQITVLGDKGHSSHPTSPQRPRALPALSLTPIQASPCVVLTLSPRWGNTRAVHVTEEETEAQRTWPNAQWLSA